MGQDTEEPPPYVNIKQNEFLHRKHRKQKEEDIAICECRPDANDLDSACGDECLNVLTSTECTPLYCPCDKYCQNQIDSSMYTSNNSTEVLFSSSGRFQKCQYARTRLFKTEGRGWGLCADEDIKAGQFVIEYCGEVISWKEARRRSHAYENQGLKDAYIISLNASESIDATRKGSLARFINHSCQPNCETRKWHVLGEIRVGIFAKEDIPAGAELSYDYNFEWYGGAKVRCLCGAGICSGFLGAKSRGFQEDTYLWEDDDDRYSVEKIPLYDSAEDEPNSKLPKVADSIGDQYATDEVNFFVKHDDSDGELKQLGPVAPVDHLGVSMPDKTLDIITREPNEDKRLYSEDSQKIFSPNDALISRIRSNSAGRNHQIGPASVSKKRLKLVPKERQKATAQNWSDAKFMAQMLAPKEAQEELVKYEDMRNGATAQLDFLYNEIRPAIEEHERDSQDSVATSIAEKWVEASCLKMKAEFDLYSSMIKHILFTPRRIEPLDGDSRFGRNCIIPNPSSDTH